MKLLNTLCFLLFLTSTQSSPVSPRAEEYRLPLNSVEVETYNITLNLESDVFTTNKFNGSVSIRFVNNQETNQIKLHANNINITKQTLRIGVSTIIVSLEVPSYNRVTDVVTLTAREHQLLAGAVYTLEIEYDAQLRTNEMYGFYKSSYVTPENEISYLATTQFEPTHARKVFPCFDEPSYKATFDITIRHPRIYTAIGNTPTSSATSDGTHTTTTFLVTPRMSTYLVAFVVSDFTCTKGADIDLGVPSQVCSRQSTNSTRKVAVEAAPKLTEILQNYTGIRYSESGIWKLDQFGIPDFSAGAMENWGIITYRETNILWDELESSNLYKQRLEAVVAHELAHMWFGNLVTTHWWSDTFLNEGFARYFQYFATAKLEPTWELDKQFVIEQLQVYLASDASINSAPLSQGASTPSEISLRFGSVSYNKGASILRMVIHFLGEDNFKAGIQSYLSANKYNNTTPAVLWEHLRQQAPPGLPAALDVIMQNWVEVGGFPVLTVTATGERVLINQTRFLSSGSSADKWYVPITYTTSRDANKFENTSTNIWLRPDGTVDTSLGADDWIILNNQQIGYYRVNYDSSLWSRIRVALTQPNFGGIHVLNRAQIVDDYYNFARVGHVTYSSFFDHIEFLQNDTSYYSWYPAFTGFSNILQRISHRQLYSDLSAHILRLMQQLLASVPFDRRNDNEHVYTLNRASAQSWACRLGQEECIRKSNEAFARYKSTEIKPDKNLKSVIYCNALRNSADAQSDWNFLWEQYGKTNLATEDVTILSALGCAKDKDVLVGYLRKSIDSNSGIRQQDALSVFSAVYTGNPEGVDIAFEFLVENYRNIASYYGSMNSLNNLFSGLAARFTTKEQTDKLDQFLNQVQDLDESVKNSARNYLASAIANLEVTADLEKELLSYFNGETGSSSASLRIGMITILSTIFVICHHLM